jgi:hypothetical protein
MDAARSMFSSVFPLLKLCRILVKMDKNSNFQSNVYQPELPLFGSKHFPTEIWIKILSLSISSLTDFPEYICRKIMEWAGNSQNLGKSKIEFLLYIKFYNEFLPVNALL